MCAICSVGDYCVTCLESDTACPSSGVYQYSCFHDSTSPQGSYSIDQCACINNMSRITIAPQYYICASLPFGARVVNGVIMCMDGYTPKRGVAGAIMSCSLCSPGQYALVADSRQTQPQFPLSCQSCPLNSYTSSSIAVGGCTACPQHQYTQSPGSVSTDQCLCADGQAKSSITGTCIGCTSSQYFHNVSRQCLACPANTVSPTGATAASQCQCAKGFSMNANAQCDLCATGTYYISPSAACRTCPPGSTTAGLGATGLSACGRTPELCSFGYIWRTTGGCMAQA